MATLILPDGTRLDGEVPLSHAFTSRALPDGTVMLDSTGTAGDDGEGVDLHASTHAAGGSDPVLVSALGGTLLPTHGGTGLSTIPAGAIPYASALDTIAALAIGASGTVLKSNGSAPSWGQVADADVAAAAAIGWSKISKSGSSLADLATRSAADLSSGTLADARLSANVPLLDAANIFTADQTLLKPTGSGAKLNVKATSPVGGTGFNSELDLFATASIRSGFLRAANASGAATRAIQLTAETDHDGNRLPIWISTQNTSGSSIIGLSIGAGVNVGHARYGGGDPTAATVMQVAGTTSVFSTQMGADYTSTADSSATAAVLGARMKASTAASAFTTALLASAYAMKPLLGAGSAATVSASAYIEDGTGVGATSFSLYGAGGQSALNGPLGINLGANVAPGAKLHVVETSAGAVPETVRLGNQSTSSGSGTEVGFHADALGAQKYASIRGVTTAASAANGDLVLSAQKASSGGPLERLRMVGAGECFFVANGTSVPVGTPSGGGYLIVVAGALKWKGSAGTVTTLAVA
jgi:hypothetical protein